MIAIPMINIIRILPGDHAPVGYIASFVASRRARRPAPGWHICDGTRLSCGAYPDLYEVIGDYHCPPMIEVPQKPGPFTALLLALGLPVRRKMILAPNPDYVPGMFRIPDLRVHHGMTEWV